MPDFSWTLVSPTVTILMVRAIDARTVDVLYGVAPDPTLASNPASYSILPTLTVSAVQKITNFQYRLTTSRQTPGTLYTLSTIGF